MDKAEPGERQYAEVQNVHAALSAVEESLADHNATSKRPMPLAIFLFALEHVSRISRLMKQPGGHMLLVGVGGSGRQSLAKLAAFMAGLEVFQVSWQNCTKGAEAGPFCFTAYTCVAMLRVQWVAISQTVQTNKCTAVHADSCMCL